MCDIDMISYLKCVYVSFSVLLLNVIEFFVNVTVILCVYMFVRFVSFTVFD